MCNQEFDLVPGENVVATEFHYEPDNANDTTAQGFLTQFIQTGNNLDLTIDGDGQSSPFASLQPALDGVTLETSITGLNHPNIITSAHVVITLDSLVTNLVSVEFQVKNPLDTDMVIEFVQADSGLDGITYAFFRQSFDGFVIPAGQTVGSGLFPNVLLTQGAVASLDIIPRGILDISAANTVRIGGTGGYQIPWLKLEQKSVPTTYDIVLSLGGVATTVDGLLNKAKEILSPHHSTGVSTVSSTQTVSAGGDGGEAAVTTKSSATVEATAGDQSASKPAPATNAASKATTEAAVASARATETAPAGKALSEPSSNSTSH